MSTAKHTAGPWSVGHMADPEHPCECRTIFSETCAGGVATISKNNGLDIRDGGNDAPPEPEAIANAHLIAAAPELYEALKEFMATYAGDETLCDQPDVRDCWRLARAALAKADGER